jgi:hypothetical protein
VRTLATSTVAVSLLQSVGEYVVVGSTVKLVHGEFGEVGDTKGDLDLSVMSAIGKGRVGLVVRNVSTPSFSLDAAGSEAVELQRQARFGFGWGSGWPGKSQVNVAFDADLLRRATPLGDRRDIAGGVETWWYGGRLGIRGGARRSTVGDAREVFAGGVSAGLMAGMFVEGHVARGSRDEQSWSIGIRMAF